MSRDAAVMRGRERFHSLAEPDRSEALRAAPYTMSGLTLPALGRACQRAVFSADERAEAEGLLEEAADPKRPCGLSRALCWHLHPSPCRK